MRQQLLVIDLHSRIPVPGGSVPVFGLGLLALVWLVVAAALLYRHFRRFRLDGDFWGQAVFYAVILAAVVYAPYNKAVSVLPIQGFGTAVIAGLLAGIWLGRRRAAQVGLPPEIVNDAATWIILAGILGARIVYVARFPQAFFFDADGKTVPLMQALVNVAMISTGGLVLYGGVAGAAVAYYVFCRRQRLPLLNFGDVIMPSIFVGEGLGRVGCFLNGCCYGDLSNLPWAVRFPASTAPFLEHQRSGLLLPSETQSLPIHPTQLYSTLNAFLLAAVCWHFFWRRRRAGDVVLLGAILYPITRFCLEIIRGDEPFELGTRLTFSQLFSLGMLASALLFSFVPRPPALWNLAAQHASPSPPPAESLPQEASDRRK